jgi:HK97 family phage major capsid protein
MEIKVKDLELPAGVNLTDNEKKGLEMIWGQIKSAIEDMAMNMKSGEEITANVKSELEKVGITGEKLEKLEKAIKAQGEALTMMKGAGSAHTETLDAQIKSFVEDKANIDAAMKKQSVSRDIVLKDAALMTTTNAKPAIEAWNVEVDRTIHATPEEANAIYPRLAKGSTSSPIIKWVDRVDKEGGAAFIEEGAMKPLEDWNYETETSEAKKIAVSCKVSTEMLSDAPFMRAEINRLLREDLMKVVDEKLLTGTGSSGEIKGITVGAAGYTSSDLDDKITTPNYADAIRAAILQLRMLNYTPNILFVNPVDKAMIDLTKDTTGRYISAELMAIMRGLTIIETTRIEKGKFLLMDSSKWTVRPYEALRLEYGWENDDFRKNLVTVIAEMRLHSYHSDVDNGSIVYAEFATVMAALEKPAA